MVTSYYIMKLTNNKTPIDLDDYFCDNERSSKELKNIFSNDHARCRVCLREGSLSIYNNETASEVTDALRIFTSIEVSKDDLYPKHLCNTCYNFLENAIKFRKMAYESNQLLQRQLKLKENKLHEYDFKIYTVNSSENDKNSSLLNNVKHKHLVSDTKIQCTTCNKIIKKSYYKIHMTMHDPNHEKYICDICGKTFRLRVGYHNHRLRHRTDFPYKCQLCPFKGQYAERLKSHMRTHLGDYRYMCTECPARFLFKGNFNSHVLLKHKEPQHKCENCKKAFHTKLKLQRHYEVDHLGIKSHVCNTCGRAFGYRNAMMKHQRRVHKREKLRFHHNPSQGDNKC